MKVVGRYGSVGVGAAMLAALVVLAVWGVGAIERVWAGGTTVLTFEREPPDLAHLGYAENLLAREAAGEWTRAEGLIATLRLFAGEADAADVLRSAELDDHSGTGVFWLALEYFASDEVDPASEAEIRRLLDQLVYSVERLEQMAGLDGTVRAPGVQLIALLDDDDGPCAPSSVPCLVAVHAPELDALFGSGKYTLWVPTDYYEHGWTDDHYTWALDAMVRSAKRYETGTLMPKTALVLSILPGPSYINTNLFDPLGCSVHINKTMQGEEEGPFKQRIASQLAFCMFQETFPTQVSAGSQWWTYGLAAWLSNEVYPLVNLEWGAPLKALEAEELTANIFERWSNTNWLYFQHLAQPFGNMMFIEVVHALPAIPVRETHRQALASFEWSAGHLLWFVQDLTDRNINDPLTQTSQKVPYSAPSDTVEAKPNLLVVEDPDPFGTVRLHVVVPAGKVACLEYEWSDDVNVAWRPGAPGPTNHNWSIEVPEELEGEMVIIATTTENAQTFEMMVVDVADANDPTACSCVAGYWLLDQRSAESLHEQMQRELWDDWFDRSKVAGHVIAYFEALPRDQVGTIESGGYSYRLEGNVHMWFGGWQLRTRVHYEATRPFVFHRASGRREEFLHELKGWTAMRADGVSVGPYAATQGQLLMLLDMSGVSAKQSMAAIENLLGFGFDRPDIEVSPHVVTAFVAPPESRFRCSGNRLSITTEWGTVEWDRLGPGPKGKANK